MYNPFSLEGKTIFVTGASSGIGKAIAIECSKIGANVIISGRNIERLDETFSALEGNRHLQISADLCKEEDMQMLVEKLPPLDGIAHCAGITDHKPVQFINSDNLNKIMAINFISPTLITSTLVKNKKMKLGGSIIFIASTAGIYSTYMTGSSYSATKGALSGIAKGMALELASKRIRVNTVCPGMVKTSILDTGDRITEEQQLEDMKKYPLKRYGEPEEVAYAVIYLLSDASRWVTGTNLLIDGGLTLS